MESNNPYQLYQCNDKQTQSNRSANQHHLSTSNQLLFRILLLEKYKTRYRTLSTSSFEDEIESST